ncbi:MAG: pre-peptidase C-terminal domain-containing protein, partial [Paracoccaceae bacterium]
MCTLCSATRPAEPNAWADMHVTSASGGGIGIDPGISRAAYTLDQISNQLTDGYWGYTGASWRAFDVSPGGTLTYDMTALSSAERYLAVSALQAWTDVTGIRFVAAAPPPVITQRNEVGDAAASTLTTNAMLVNQNFNGTVSASGDEDWVRVTLVAGTTYTIALNGVTLTDPYLSIRNSAGTQVAFSDDDGPGLNSLLSFTPSTSGTYYLSARGYSTTTGSYDLTLTTGGSADLTFDNTQPNAFSTSDLSGNTILSSYVNIASTWDSDGPLLNTYFFQ